MIKPMLCQTGTKSVLAKKNFLFEPKLDGTRAIAHASKTSVRLINRRGKNIAYRYPEIAEELKKLPAKKCVLDGEIIVYDAQGNPDFSLLQRREQVERKALIEIRSKQFPATYVVFDILEYEGKSLLGEPLHKRKAWLNRALNELSHVEKIFATPNGKDLWKKIIKRKLEGVIAKKADSKYYSGKRVPVWLKIKNTKTTDCVIVGFAQEKRIISSLCLAAYDDNKLRYVGRVGTGFTEEFLEELHKKLKPLKVKKSPVQNPDPKCVWVKPKIVCEVEYLELTKQKILRMPSFKRLRNDKPLRECTLNA